MSDKEQPLTLPAITDEVVRYIARYGGMCRDCADEDGTCPSSGLPCEDPDKAIRHVLTALTYGLRHGYLNAAKIAAHRLATGNNPQVSPPPPEENPNAKGDQ